MKTNIILSFLLFFTLENFAQSISIKAIKSNGVLQTAGKVILDDPKITIENVTVICDDFTFSPSVKHIKIVGLNKITCKNVKLESNTSAIEIDADDGTLTIEYTGSFNDNNRNFLLKKAKGVKLIFKKI